MRKRELIPFLVGIILITTFTANAEAANVTDKLKKNSIKQYLTADDYVEEGNYKNALEIIEPILDKNPNDTNARITLGYIYSGMYKLDSAYQEFARILNEFPNNSDALNGLGMIYYKKTTSSDMTIRSNLQKYYDTALSCFEKAIAADPKNYKAYNNAGKIYQETGNINKAEIYYRKAIEIKPSDSDTLKNLGTVLFAKNQIDDAINMYVKSISVQKKNPPAYYYLGEAYIAKGDYSKAINYLNISLFQFSNSAPVHNLLGKAYELQGNEAAALTEFRKSILIKPEYGAPYLNMTNIYQRRGDNEFASSELRNALSINPDFIEGKLKIADISLTLGDYDKAVSYYKEVLISPEYSNNALKGLAKAYFMRAQKINDSTNYLRESDYLELEKSLKKAILNNPDDTQLYLALLRVSRLLGNTYQAQIYFNKITQDTSTLPMDNIIRGEAGLTYKHYRDANVEFKKALSFVNDSSDLVHLGEIFVINRQYDIAKQAFNRVLKENPRNKKALKGLRRIKENEAQAVAKYNVAKEFYEGKQPLASIEALRDCVSLNPSVSEAQLLLAKIFEENKYYFNAIEHYTAYINLVPKYSRKYNKYQRKIKKLEAKVERIEYSGNTVKKYTRI